MLFIVLCYLPNHNLIVTILAIDISSVKECYAFVECFFQYGGPDFMGEGSIQYA